MEMRQAMTYGAIAVSVLVLATFLGGVTLAYIHHDAQSQSLYTGAIIANATTAVGFWLGSSAGSQKKDEKP